MRVCHDNDSSCPQVVLDLLQKPRLHCSSSRDATGVQSCAMFLSTGLASRQIIIFLYVEGMRKRILRI